MGQTLTHGIYLPDEGERNCYNGLASNWSILDGAVGTVAAHTSALAGKAPLVHTHTKADITDFPAYGNAAGTICEGNDSRLSDARTPVAHTHTKADVTDLFNSANTWSGDNTYSKTVAIERSTDTGNFLTLKNTVAELGSTPASATPVTIAFRDKDNDNLGYMGVYYDTDGSNHFRLYVRNKYTSGAPSTTGSYDYAFFGLRLNADKSKEGILKASFRPYDNNTHDLGSSNYQWNNLYAKNYYYNGVAWGLDKANVWTKTQDFVGEYQGTELSANYNTCFGMYGVKDTVGKSGMFFTKHRPNKAQGSLTSSDIIQYGVDVLENKIRTNNVFDLQVCGYDSNTGEFTRIDVISILSNANLGTSTNQWKTLNGINPGALGLPSGNYDPIDTNGWDFTGATGQSYTPTVNGWLFISIQNIAGNYLSIVAGRGAVSVDGTGAQIGLRAMLPVIANESVGITVKTSVIFAARFYPMQGNVS